MPHVTFLHGMSNKPPAADLLRLWQSALADADDPVPLGDLGVTSSLIYWADLLYERPDDDIANYEGVLESTAEAIDGGGDAPPPVPGTAEEAAFLRGLRAHLTSLEDELLEDGVAPQPTAGSPALERIPLPWALKKRMMNAWLRDVHHYLFDTEFGPPGKPPVRIQTTIRARVLAALSDPKVSRPHVLVSHSMGTVIAYDCLKRVPDCPAIDGLITLGSPLGLDEIQDKLQPEWRRKDGFPAAKVTGGWANLFDRLDPVCGFDAQLANDFLRDEVPAIADTAVQNTGLWRHSITKYLRQPALCRTLRTMLGR